MAELRFEIKKSLGCISDEKGGWAKELNLVSWNNNDPKYDIRYLSESNGGEGLSADELKRLRDLLNTLDI